MRIVFWERLGIFVLWGASQFQLSHASILIKYNVAWLPPGYRKTLISFCPGLLNNCQHRNLHSKSLLYTSPSLSFPLQTYRLTLIFWLQALTGPILRRTKPRRPPTLAQQITTIKPIPPPCNPSTIFPTMAKALYPLILLETQSTPLIGLLSSGHASALSAS